jgi:uncharacterized DUF497 family protein
VGDLGFVWDPKKARSNERKHGVSFEEAQSVFSDENGLLLDDPDHSERETRYLLLGLSSSLRILVVSHTLRGADTIRIISAREADPSETRQYLERLGK